MNSMSLGGIAIFVLLNILDLKYEHRVHASLGLGRKVRDKSVHYDRALKALKYLWR
jgi:hypothetical protein